MDKQLIVVVAELASIVQLAYCVQYGFTPHLQYGGLLSDVVKHRQTKDYVCDDL